MCLGVPGKLVAWLNRDPLFAKGLVEFAGVRRECHLACVTEAQEGDYVIVHAGIAICTVDPLQAQGLLDELERRGDRDWIGEESP